MADRSSAAVFGEVFDILAKERSGISPGALGRISKEIWKHTFAYDFSHYQMDADKALVALGLCKLVEDEVEGTISVYRTPSGTGWDD